MRRRTFISSVSGVVALPLAARGQQSGKLPTLGFLGSNNSAAQSQMIAVFLQRLRDLGWTEGRTIAIEYRWAEGRAERAAQIAADFVRLKVDVILTSGTENVIEVKQATSTIPIVFAAAADPVSTGLVASLAKPAGNITGLSTQQTDLAGKCIELLREAVPGLRRLGVLVPGGSPGAALDLREVQASARALGLETVPIDIRGAEDITRGFETLGGHVDGLLTKPCRVISAYRGKADSIQVLLLVSGAAS